MYVDLATFKAYLGITTTTDDALLVGFLNRAQGVIEARTGRVFECANDSILTFDAVRDVSDRTLLLGTDLCQITEIVNGDGAVVSASAYLTDPPRGTPFWGIRLKRSSDPWAYQGDPEGAISVEGRWAYSVLPPEDIVQATLRLAAFLYRQKDNAVDGDRPIMTGDGNVLLPSRLPNDVAEMLRPYMRKM